MSAVIHENDIPQVVELLQSLADLKNQTFPAGLDADEVAVLASHRRQKILTRLENKNITVRPSPAVEPPAEIPA